MKKYLYKVVFENYDVAEIRAGSPVEAAILVQAERIKTGKPFGVRHVEQENETGQFEYIGKAHLEVVK